MASLCFIRSMVLYVCCVSALLVDENIAREPEYLRSESFVKNKISFSSSVIPTHSKRVSRASMKYMLWNLNFSFPRLVVSPPKKKVFFLAAGAHQESSKLQFGEFVELFIFSFSLIYIIGKTVITGRVDFSSQTGRRHHFALRAAPERVDKKKVMQLRLLPRQ